MESTALGSNEKQPLLPVRSSTPLLPRWATSYNSKQSFANVFYVALNTLSTIAIVFLNKYVLSDSQLRKAQISIAAWHFLATFLVLMVSAQSPWRLFRLVWLPVRQVFPLAAFFAAFLLLNNASLALNPVGFYQLCKIMTTPTVVALNWYLFSKPISRAKLAAVSVCCVGVALASSASLYSNPAGAAVAVAAFTSTACYQIWIGKKMKDLDADAPQLLLNQSVTAMLILIPVAGFVDTRPDLSRVETQALLALVAGGIIASIINLSQFLIIGRTSPLTFNIVSNVKMVAIIGLGWWSEGKIFTVQDIAGVLFASAGAWYYSVECRKD